MVGLTKTLNSRKAKGRSQPVSTSIDIQATFDKRACLKAAGEGHLFRQVDVIDSAEPLQYCRWIRVQPVPCKGFFPSVYQDTK